MKKLLLLLAIGLLAIYSCKKDKPEPAATNNTTTDPAYCHAEPLLAGLWVADSSRSVCTDSMGTVFEDTTFPLSYPSNYFEWQFHCLEDNLYGYNIDSLKNDYASIGIDLGSWSYWYYKIVQDSSVDEQDDLLSYYSENGIIYVAATSAQDTSLVSTMFVIQALTTSNLFIYYTGNNDAGGTCWSYMYFTKN